MAQQSGSHAKEEYLEEKTSSAPRCIRSYRKVGLLSEAVVRGTRFRVGACLGARKRGGDDFSCICLL